MATSSLQLRRWTRAEYDRLIDLGVFQPGEPIELIGGQLMVCEPQGRRHAWALAIVDHRLRAALGSGWTVRTQMPVDLDDESEPEPDLAVVSGTPEEQPVRHPARLALIVEVAESSLGTDREVKGSLYARAGLGDYWIANLVNRVLEVYRKPVVDSAAPYGWRYASVTTLRPGDTVSPLAAPAARVPVADLLP
ncbi:MAG: Uma2 family endonuclease [Candidatus Rokubacteria bacterium]|nr:Uma2 family endonuclease [Candidatus Rokubacteria bacterium]